MTYTFPPFVPGIAIAVGVVATVLGLYFANRKATKAAVISFVVATVGGAIMAPTLAMDRVVLDDQKLEQATGFWFAQTVKGFELADVVSIKIEVVGRGTRRQHEVWIATFQNGRTKTIDPGDLWVLNGSDIAARLEARGIPVR